MSELERFQVDGPVKYFKILTSQEKQSLIKRRIIQEDELDARIMSFHDEQKRVIGYDIENFNK